MLVGFVISHRHGFEGRLQMLASGRAAPALSPVLLLGFALRGAPRLALQGAADVAMNRLARAHPEILQRLEGLANPDFLIDPVDLPIRFHLSVARTAPRLRVLDEEAHPQVPVAATIRGSLTALIDLLEGRVDGDALFFSRALSVEGDMGAVVALRNAVDGSDVSLTDDLVRFLGPFGSPARRLLALGGSLYRSAEGDLEMLRAAIVAPVQRRCDAQDGKISDLAATVERLPTRRRERQA
jgi:predicted lipid carrier protein YhbT